MGVFMSIVRGLTGFCGCSISEKHADVEETDFQVARYKPESLDSLCKITKFSRTELQMMYRGFKQECPTGIVNEETFIDIFSQFFPQGDAFHYAQFVFRSLDKNRSGSLTFEQFVTGLSVLARGSTDEKLSWTFQLYDTNHDGKITRDELQSVVDAIYEMMGQYTEPPIDPNTTKEHVDKLFEKLDQNRDDIITYEEFMDACTKDERICNSLQYFDTVI